MRKRRGLGLRWALALAVCGALLTGCGVFGGGDKVAEDGPPKIEVGADGKVESSIASLTRKQSGYEITADVIALERYDKALRLTFVITPRSDGSSDDLNSYYFSNDVSSNVNGIYLLDTKNKRMYPVLQTGDGECVCSTVDDGYPLDEPTVLFADYPVPPESVEEMTVVFGDLGPLPGVEIS